MGRYDDLLKKTRPRYERHPPMARKNRAAQFAPYAALRGFDDCIAEAARKTEGRPQLDEQEIEQLDRALQQIYRALPEETEITVNYFTPDAYKDGGSIRTFRGTVCKIDLQKKTIRFRSGTWMKIGDILQIERIKPEKQEGEASGTEKP